jgi:hypothetical protein
MTNDNGASPSETGLSSQATEPKVSALRASIPSAWEPFDYDDGYPEDEEFSAFDEAPFDFYQAAHWLLAELSRAAENMPCFCEVEDGFDSFWEKPVKVIHFSTGGWSGAESIIGLIERRFDISQAS